MMDITTLLFSIIALILAANVFIKFKKVEISKLLQGIVITIIVVLFITALVVFVIKSQTKEETISEESIAPSMGTSTTIPTPTVSPASAKQENENYKLQIYIENIEMYIRDHREKNTRYTLCTLTEEPIYSFEDRFGSQIQVDMITLINIETKEKLGYEIYTLNGYVFINILPGSYELRISKEGYKDAFYKLDLTKDKLDDKKEMWTLNHYMESIDEQYIYFKINSIKDSGGNKFINQTFMFGIDGHKRSIRTDENGNIQYTIRGKSTEYVITYEDENRNEINTYLSPYDDDIIDIVIPKN